MAYPAHDAMNLLEDDIGGGGASGGWFHCSVKTVSRGGTRASAAVAAAAYRTGMELHDELSGVTHDYTRRSGVVTTFMLAPADAPEWAFDVEQFWNRAEQAENRRNSRVARELELALPDSLTPGERKAIVAEAAQFLVDRYGVGVTAAIHAPGRRGDDRNHHAHLLFSTRRIGSKGFGAKTRELDDKAQGAKEVTALRQRTAEIINAALEAAGHGERVDWRSFKSRGISREPTNHLGPAAHEMERKGKGSRLGDENREIGAGNAALDQVVSDLAALEAELKEVQEALLDERYGPADEEPLPVTPSDPAAPVSPPVEADAPATPAEAPASDSDKPDWWGERRRPEEPIAPDQVDAFMQQAVQPYLDQLQEHGTLHDGEPEGLRMHERASRRTLQWLRGAASWAHNKWQSFVANRRSRREHYGRGPDLER